MTFVRLSLSVVVGRGCPFVNRLDFPAPVIPTAPSSALTDSKAAATRSQRRIVELLLEPATVELLLERAIDVYFGILERMKLSASSGTPCVGSVMKSLGANSSS